MLAVMDRLRKARLDRGWTLYRAAKEAGVSTAMLENLEMNPEARPRARVSTVEAICFTFPEVPLSFFIPQARLNLEPRTERCAVDWESNRL